MVQCRSTRGGWGCARCRPSRPFGAASGSPTLNAHAYELPWDADSTQRVIVRGIVDVRCGSCHSRKPTEPGLTAPPNAISFDTAEDIAVLLTIRRTRVPPEMHPGILEFTEKTIEVSERLVQAASELEELQEASFGGRGADRVLELIEEVSQGEYEADCLQTDLSRRLYLLEDQVDPTSIYFIMKLFRLLGEIANHAENTGDNLRMMLTKG